MIFLFSFFLFLPLTVYSYENRNLQYLNEDSPVKCASNSTACDPQGENLIDSFAGVETIEDCRYIDEQKNQKCNVDFST